MGRAGTRQRVAALTAHLSASPRPRILEATPYILRSTGLDGDTRWPWPSWGPTFPGQMAYREHTAVLLEVCLGPSTWMQSRGWSGLNLKDTINSGCSGCPAVHLDEHITLNAFFKP